MQGSLETDRCNQNYRKIGKAVPVGRVRVALIGCGKISKDWHLPILTGHEGIQLVAMVDRDAIRCAELAQAYRVPRVMQDASDLRPEDVDAAIIATPPFHHAPCAIQLIQRGIHVFVEKPMATRYVDAAAMVRTAEEHGVALGVGFFRRLMPSTRLLKSMVDSEWLGRPIGFRAEGGGFYNWPAATLGNMRKEWAGGGVLIDFGSHLWTCSITCSTGPDMCWTIGTIPGEASRRIAGLRCGCCTRHKKLLAWWRWPGPGI